MIEGCANPESELRDALEAIPADIRAYDPGFEDALNGALEQRAVGCTGSDPFRNDQTTDPGVTSADDGSPGPANPAPVPFEPSGPEPGIPIAVIALIAALGGALLLAVGLAGGRAVGLAAPRAPGALGRHLRRLGELAADSLWVLRRRLGL